jgi:hypothetical protein
MERNVLGLAAALVFAGSAAGQTPPPKSVPFEPGTQVDGAVLQVMFRERALFRLDDGGKPVLDSIETGELAVAHPIGTVAENYASPGPGLLAAALDGSIEKQATFLKVWNRTGGPIEYRAVVLEVQQGNVLHPVLAPTCPVLSGAMHTESWPVPIAAVALSGFKPASKAALARCAGAARPAAKKGK